MTPQELEMLRINARILALETLLAGLLRSFGSLPNVRPVLLAKLDEFAQSYGSLTLPYTDAATSDLLAGETQQAIRDLASYIKSNIERP